MQGRYEFVRCMTLLEGCKVLIVGDNGAAVKATSALQLANALSLSIWDLSDQTAAPVLEAVATNQQVSCTLY